MLRQQNLKIRDSNVLGKILLKMIAKLDSSVHQ